MWSDIVATSDMVAMRDAGNILWLVPFILWFPIIM